MMLMPDVTREPGLVERLVLLADDIESECKRYGPLEDWPSFDVALISALREAASRIAEAERVAALLHKAADKLVDEGKPTGAGILHHWADALAPPAEGGRK